MERVRKSANDGKLIVGRRRLGRTGRCTWHGIPVGWHEGSRVIVGHFGIVAIRGVLTALGGSGGHTEVKTVHQFVCPGIEDSHKTRIANHRNGVELQRQMRVGVNLFGSQCGIDIGLQSRTVAASHQQRQCEQTSGKCFFHISLYFY